MSQIKPAAKAKAPKAKLRLHILEARKEQGYRLRVMYRSLGWSRAQCAKFLHVSERTLHNWECGRHEIPYAAYKLLRIHCGMELPGSQWRDWSFSRGKLWTPEGHGLTPKDAAWWSLLTLRAELGAKAIRELHALRSPQRASAASQHGAAPAPTCGSAELAPGADAVSGAAAQPARGLVSYKTSRPFSPSKIIAPNSYTVFCYKF